MAACLAVLHIGWIFWGAQRSITPEVFGFLVSLTNTSTLLTLLCGAFLSLGRHRVLGDPTSYWIGVGFASLSVALLFRVFTMPWLPGAKALFGHMPSTPAWIGMFASSLFGACLLVAVLERNTTDEAVPATRSLWLAAIWPVSVAAISMAFVIFERHLPVLLTATGTFSPLLVVWQLLNTALLAVGAILATRHYLHVRDVLPAYVAFAQVALAFGLLGVAAGGSRYSLLSVVDRFIVVGAYVVMAFGLLSDYVRLLSRERQKSRDLQARSAELVGILEGIPDAVFVTDCEGGVRFASRSALNLLGIPNLDGVRRPLAEWAMSYGVRDKNDRPIAIEELPTARVVRGDFVHNEEIQFVDPKLGTPHCVLISGRPLIDEAGRAVGGLVVATEITDRKERERQILQLNRELDHHVDELQAALGEKQVLLQEVQHRVKNNLAVISALLGLEADRWGSSGAGPVLVATRDRVRSMALIHDRLYYVGTAADIDFAEYVEALGRELLASYGAESRGIELHTEVQARLGLDEAVPCGLIINELLTNSLKHAFPDGRKGEIWLELCEVGDAVDLRYRDNGIGLPPGLDIKRADSLGMQLISDLAAQLGGTLESEAGNHAAFRLKFRSKKFSSESNAEEQICES